MNVTSQRDKVAKDVLEAVNREKIDQMPYGTFWLTSELLPGRPASPRHLHHHISFCAWYPDVHSTQGTLVAGNMTPHDHLLLTENLQLLDHEVARDAEEFGTMRKGFDMVALEEGIGGYLAEAQEFCAEKKLPFGFIAFWKNHAADRNSSFASFHPVSIVSPELALKSLKFTLWQEKNES